MLTPNSNSWEVLEIKMCLHRKHELKKARYRMIRAFLYSWLTNESVIWAVWLCLQITRGSYSPSPEARGVGQSRSSGVLLVELKTSECRNTVYQITDLHNASSDCRELTLPREEKNKSKHEYFWGGIVSLYWWTKKASWTGERHMPTML